MKKKIIGIILAGMMIMTACGNAGKAEPEGLSEGRTESSEEASSVEESTEESSVVEEDSANNKFAQKTVEKSGKTFFGSAVSGEGLVNVYKGTGKILMAPLTSKLKYRDRPQADKHK